MGEYVQDCEDFYLHIGSNDSTNGNPANFTVGLPAPRSLRGRWRMALKELTFTKWDKERSFNDEMQFIVYARRGETNEYQDYCRWAIAEGIMKPIYQFTSTSIPGWPNAAVVAFNKEKGRPERGTWSGPDGQFDRPEDYVENVNGLLREMWRDGIFHAAPFFYLTDKGGAYKTVVSNCNYAFNHHRRIFIFPILGTRNRRLLGFPTSFDTRPMINLVIKSSPEPGAYPDVEIGEEGFTQKDDNIFVLCDLVRSTGAQTGIDGSILRVIPNKREAQGTVVFNDFSEDYYEVTPKSSFFSVHLRLVSSRDYRDLNLAHPTTFTLHFKPVNRCQPQPKKILV